MHIIRLPRARRKRYISKRMFTAGILFTFLCSVIFFAAGESSNVEGEIPKVIQTNIQAPVSSYMPRVTAPSKSNPYYYSELNVYYQSGLEMPNCTAYAWGRTYEILGKEPKLSRGDAGDYYGYNKKNHCYSYGTKPRLGAIVCWKKGYSGKGHVAVVEKITKDDITISESGYKTFIFKARTVKAKDIKSKIGYQGFQGYIYADVPD